VRFNPLCSFESGNQGLALVDLSLSTEQPWLKEQN